MSVHCTPEIMQHKGRSRSHSSHNLHLPQDQLVILIAYNRVKTRKANAQATCIQNSHKNLMNIPPLSPLTLSHYIDLRSRSFWVMVTLTIGQGHKVSHSTITHQGLLLHLFNHLHFIHFQITTTAFTSDTKPWPWPWVKVNKIDMDVESWMVSTTNMNVNVATVIAPEKILTLRF